MKEFSEAEKNDGYKTNIKYVLDNYFRDFTLHKSCKPQYKHSTLFENALAFYKRREEKLLVLVTDGRSKITKQYIFEIT